MAQIPETVALFDADSYLQAVESKVTAVSGDAIALERTCFYPEGGGQPGDRGSLSDRQGRTYSVLDTYRDRNRRSLIWHRLGDDALSLAAGITLKGTIDWERRYCLMRMHSCLHLLCSVIEAPVTGCAIGEAKGRLDFDLPVATLDKAAITGELSRLIAMDRPISSFTIRENVNEEIQRLTRTTSARPPVIDGGVRIVEIAGIDRQPCGGTHVKATSEIGGVYCSKIEKKSRHNRRFHISFS